MEEESNLDKNSETIEDEVPIHYGGLARYPFIALIVSYLVLDIYFGNLITHFTTITILTYFRLKNIGIAPWACLVALIPIANLFFLIFCMACQEGFNRTDKLDTPGKIIAVIFGLFFLVNMYLKSNLSM
jgi:hypothetical protein